MDFNVDVQLVEGRLNLSKGLSAWILTIKAKVGGRIIANLNSNTDGMDHYIECIEVAELPGAYICCAFYQKDMNDTFTRMGIFMGAGKGVKQGTLLAHNDHTLVNYKKLVAGHNLPGPVIAQFSARLAAEKEASLFPNAFEAEFLKKFLLSEKIRSKGERFYVIGFSIQNMKSSENVVTHEIFHAKFFLDQTYRKVIKAFWRNSVRDADRSKITEIIGQAYNTDDEDLVIDEFQAYLLQANAEQDRMKLFVESYRLALEGVLAQNGFTPLQIK